MADPILAMTIRDFIQATAARQPTPGGGAVAGVCGALAAALGAMAMEYTVGKKTFAAYDAELRSALAQFRRAADLFQELIVEDVAAYEALSVLLKLPDPERTTRPEYLPTVVAAIRVPQTAAGLAMNVLDQGAALLDKTNKLLISDLGIAAIYAHATVHASELNVRINLPLLPNRDESRQVSRDMANLSERADILYADFRKGLLERM